MKICPKYVKEAQCKFCSKELQDTKVRGGNANRGRLFLSNPPAAAVCREGKDAFGTEGAEGKFDPETHNYVSAVESFDE